MIKFIDCKDPMSLLLEGIDRIRSCLFEVLSMTREELAESPLYWHTPPLQTRLPDNVIFAFTSGTCNNLKHFRTKKIAANLNNLGLLPPTAKGKPMIKFKSAGLSMVAKIQGFSLAQQRDLLADILKTDDVFTSLIWSPNYCLDYRELLASARSPNELETTFNRILPKSLLTHARKAQGATINLAGIWLAAFFFSKGAIKWDDDQLLQNSEYFLNGFNPYNGYVFFRLLAGGRSEYFTKLINLAREMKGAPTKTLRAMLLDHAFLNADSAVDFFDALLAFKRRLNNQMSVYSGCFLNRIYDLTRKHFKAITGITPHAEFFGRGARYQSSFSEGFFSWITSPEKAKLSHFENYAGFKFPESVPIEIVKWAELCRDVIPFMQKKDVGSLKRSLDLWLVYLIRLWVENPKNFPPGPENLDRNQHIKLSGTNFTFMTFLDECELCLSVKDQALVDLQKTLSLAETKYNLTFKHFPINREFDKYKISHKRDFKTPREAIPLELYNLIKTENRKDKFGFARGLQHKTHAYPLYQRFLPNKEEGQLEAHFFPAMPIILDLILTSGARSKDALSCDSGEGDEILVNAMGIEINNCLSTATSGRQKGLLSTRSVVTPEGKRSILGLYFIESKTGPYFAPYVDPETAVFLEEMRDWQMQHFPIDGPVKLMSHLEMKANNHDMYEDIYPLFRDPIRKAGIVPPHPTTLANYWNKLLGHCDELYFSQTGRRGVFLVDGKARWDIHSIRVTNITILLENNVPLHIVAMLHGHRSLHMTLHYRSPNIANVQKIVTEAQLRMKEQILDYFEHSSAELDVDQYENLLFASNDAKKMFEQAARRRTPPDIFIHGICPGAHCSSGLIGTGNERGGKSVFRPRACSKCRFRITGHAFIEGLVWRCNALLAEYRIAIERISKLRQEAEIAEENGNKAKARDLVMAANRLEIDQDHILEEWALELSTINKLRSTADTGTNALIVTDCEAFETIHNEVHDFTHLQNIIHAAEVYFDATHEVPPEILERRNQIFRIIAQKQDLQDLYLKLTDDEHHEAMSALCNLLAQSSQLPEICTGEVRLQELMDLSSILDASPKDLNALHPSLPGT